MPSIYDQLNARLQDDGAGGLSPLDLGDLPDEQKQIMLALLRDPDSGFEGVTEQALREKLDGKVEKLDETLEQLTHQHWLIRLGEAPRVRYRINFRAKRGNISSLNVWNILSDRLPDDWKGTNAT